MPPEKKVDLTAAAVALVKATANEKRWDAAFGKDTRAYRDVAVYAVERLCATGVRFDDVVHYLREAVE